MLRTYSNINQPEKHGAAAERPQVPETFVLGHLLDTPPEAPFGRDFPSAKPLFEGDSCDSSS